MLMRRLHCPIAPRPGLGVMAGTKYHSPPIPRRERSPSASIWLPSGENRNGLPASPLSGARNRETNGNHGALRRRRRQASQPAREVSPAARARSLAFDPWPGPDAAAAFTDVMPPVPESRQASQPSAFRDLRDGARLQKLVVGQLRRSGVRRAAELRRHPNSQRKGPVWLPAGIMCRERLRTSVKLGGVSRGQD